MIGEIDIVDKIKLKCSVWKGYKRYDFDSNGHEGLIIKPEKQAIGNPWVWRAEFFDAFSYVDMALLNNGWHIGYVNYSNMYGCSEAIEGMRSYYNLVICQFGLSIKPSIFGFSRGGLYAFNYAVKHPDTLSSIYLDAPVLDIRSWPGGKGIGRGDHMLWQECLRCYKLTEESAEGFNGNPLDNAEFLAKTGIPLIVVVGDADDLVPYSENAILLENIYKKCNAAISVIVKHGVGHNPHSLSDPATIVDFIMKAYSQAYSQAHNESYNVRNNVKQ